MTHAERRPPDLTAQLLTRGYDLSAHLAGGEPRDALAVRLMGAPAVWLSGRQGAEAFYDTTRFQRADALPAVVSDVLFGSGPVHGLDDEAHRHRKTLFLSLTEPASVARLAEMVGDGWERGLARTLDRGAPVEVFPAAVKVIGQAVQRWAGLDVGADHVARSEDLARIVDGFGGVGPRRARARLARARADRWAGDQVDRARHGEAPPGSILEQVATFHDVDGSVLPRHTAAVELLNVLRPTVAVSWFVAFAAFALHQDTYWRDRVAVAGAPEVVAFAHEVRRHYPFVPLLAARARQDTDVCGVALRAGDRAVLDVYGTNHDPRWWSHPDAFDPSRFRDTEPDEFAFVPQGGGDARTGHRCPGEGIATGILTAVVPSLARREYRLAPSNGLLWSPRRLPPRFRDGLRILPREDGRR